MFGCVRDYDLTLLAPIEKPNTKAVSQRTKELHGEEKKTGTQWRTPISRPNSSFRGTEFFFLVLFFFFFLSRVRAGLATVGGCRIHETRS